MKQLARDSFSHEFFSGCLLEKHQLWVRRWGTQRKPAMGLHSPSFSHVDVSDLPTESGSASKRWEELRPQPTAEATNTCAYKVASTVICFVLATAESDESLSKGLRNASKCQPTSPLLPKRGLSRAGLRNFAAWQVTGRTKKPAFSKYRLLAIGYSRSASQTVQERQLGNE